MSIVSADPWGAIPQVNDGTAWRELNAPIRRRTVLKSALSLGIAASLGLLQIIGRASPAHALSEWTNCGAYTTGSPCVGAPQGTQYCSNKWFARKSGTCYSQYPVSYACDGGSGTTRNAWRWTYGTTQYRCSDGWFASCAGSGLRICTAANP